MTEEFDYEAIKQEAGGELPEPKVAVLKIPKNKICEKIKERLGAHVNESDIEKFSLLEWKE